MFLSILEKHSPEYFQAYFQIFGQKIIFFNLHNLPKIMVKITWIAKFFFQEFSIVSNFLGSMKNILNFPEAE
jgi:hypothetical protein